MKKKEMKRSFFFYSIVIITSTPILAFADDEAVCTDHLSQPQVSSEVYLMNDRILQTAEASGAVYVYPPEDLVWVKYFKAKTFLEMCFQFRRELLADEKKYPEDVKGVPIEDRSLMRSKVFRAPRINVTTLPSVSGKAVIPIDQVKSLHEWADFCVQSAGNRLKTILGENPEIFSTAPSDEFLEKFDFRKARVEMLKAFEPVLRDEIYVAKGLFWEFIEETFKPGDKNWQYLKRGVTGVPEVVKDNVVALKDFAVLTYEEPGKVASAFADFVKEAVDQPEETLWSMLLTDDPAEASTAVLETAFGLKGVQKVTREIRQRIASKIREQIQRESVEEVVKGLAKNAVDEKRILERISGKTQEEVAEILSDEKLRKDLTEVIEETVKDDILKERMLQQVQTSPREGLRKMTLEALGSLQDEKFAGAFNHRGIREVSSRVAKEAVRENRKLVAVKLDLGHFKEINDTAGHFAGDDVLEHFVRTSNQNLRGLDVVARAGGDEYLILMSVTEEVVEGKVVKTASEVAEDVVDRLTKKFNESDLVRGVNSQAIVEALKNPDARKVLENAFGRDWYKKMEPAAVMKAIQDPEIKGSLVAKLGVGWERSLKEESRIVLGQAHYALEVFPDADLDALAKASTYAEKDAIVSKVDQVADQKLTEKKNKYKNEMGTQRGKK